MNEDEAARQLALECPCKIMEKLHATGEYFHCTRPQFPGKVLCFHQDSEVPADAVPTAAQVRFWQAAKVGLQAAG